MNKHLTSKKAFCTIGIISFLLLFGCYNEASAQRDVIITQSGEEIRCRILDETPTRFIYAYLGPKGKILRNEIFKNLVQDFKFNLYSSDIMPDGDQKKSKKEDEEYIKSVKQKEPVLAQGSPVNSAKNSNVANGDYKYSQYGNSSPSEGSSPTSSNQSSNSAYQNKPLTSNNSTEDISADYNSNTSNRTIADGNNQSTVHQGSQNSTRAANIGGNQTLSRDSKNTSINQQNTAVPSNAANTRNIAANSPNQNSPYSGNVSSNTNEPVRQMGSAAYPAGSSAAVNNSNNSVGMNSPNNRTNATNVNDSNYPNQSANGNARVVNNNPASNSVTNSGSMSNTTRPSSASNSTNRPVASAPNAADKAINSRTPPTSKSTPTPSVRNTGEFNDFMKWRVGAKIGFANGMDKNFNAVSAYDLYKESLMKGLVYGADLAYFPGDNLGFGFVFNNQIASGQEERIDYINQFTGAEGSGSVEDKISKKFVGANILLRKALDYKTYIVLGLSPGMHFYNNSGAYGTTTYNLSGKTFGGQSTLGVDFLLGNDIMGRDIILSIEGGYTYGKLTQLDSGTGLQNLPTPISLNRMDISVGLRFMRFPRYLKN